MARINLLPWRKELRERKNKEFNLVMAGVAGIAGILVLAVFTFFNTELSNQQAANDRIDQENKQLEVAIKSIEDLEVRREQMLSQMKVIQDLQGRRSIPVRVWDDMARAIPKAMYLTNIKREGDVITITGQADNANVVASLVRNINASEWLDESAVVNIKSKIEAYQKLEAKTAKDPDHQPVPEESYVEFIVTTKVQAPKTEEEGATEQEGQSDTVATPSANDDLAVPVGVEPVGGATPPAPEVAAPTETAPAPAQPSPESNNAQVGVQ